MSSNLDLKNQLDWLYSLQFFGVQPGLERVLALLEDLNRPDQHFETILVAGTNGKGTTSAALASMLMASEQSVGLFTSPHLTHFTERFQVNGKPVAAESITSAIAQIRPYAEALKATFFEVLTMLACVLFARLKVQRAVFEVGLGGRLDATNALDPALSVITNVALDHTEVLGDTLAQIATEKAGILRAKRPAVTAVQSELLPILAKHEADLWALGQDFQLHLESQGWSGNKAKVIFSGPLASNPEISLNTPLLGQSGGVNVALAAVAASRLGVSARAIVQGAGLVTWPGRLEVLPYQTGRILLDGAHNPHGVEALAQTLQDLGVGRIPVIFGAAEDKDLAGLVAGVRSFASQVILTKAELSPRSAQPSQLVPLFKDLEVTLADSPTEALKIVSKQSVSEAPLIVVCGSLYLIGEIRPLLLGQMAEGRERWQ